LKVLTSYFGDLKKIPAGMVPVCIARGRPRFFSGRVELALAPTREMLKMPREDYDRHFLEMLTHLDPKTVYDRLGENAVMLCYEKPGEGCHRRIVAEWLEKALGIEIPELGLPRAQALAYNATPWKAEAPKKVKVAS
jgi:hypothetical protein